jgi:cellulose biosynthesis protein BcsQ
MGTIVTFYSYKGGVGRSMALADVGVILAQWGYRVLMIDFDLEAPGLEIFFSTFLKLSQVHAQRGVVDLFHDHALQSPQMEPNSWRQDTVRIPLPVSRGRLDLWVAGKQDRDYFKRVRSLDFPEFYSTRNGGIFIEELRRDLKSEYDFVLVDSRTGLTEIGGISTVQLPDAIVILFTATEQAFQGALDVINRASASRQSLPFERVHIPAIPIPSRLDVQAEFRISQRWLDRFAHDLRVVFSSWLPRFVKPRDLLEMMKLPHVSYFSYGENLPVLEQGTSDPGSLGYAYENLAALLARNLQEVESLVANRQDYIRSVVRERPEQPVRSSEARIFISFHRSDKRWAEMLRVQLMPLARSRSLSILENDISIAVGEDWRERISADLSEASVVVLLISPDYLASDYISDHELPRILNAAEERGLRILSIVVRPSFYTETELGRFQALNDPSQPLSVFKPHELDSMFLKMAEDIAEAAGRSY